MVEERDCLIGLAPKYDAKETARQAAIEALQQRRYLDAVDCARVYSTLCEGVDAWSTPPLMVQWHVKKDLGQYMLFHNRKNAERFAAHVDGKVVER